MSKVIYRVFYLLLHSVFTIIEAIKDLFVRSWTKLLQVYHEFPALDSKNAPLKFKNIPTHVTVLLGLEEPSLKDLANLIFWCMSAHITFISFYDCKGRLKKQEDKLHQVVQEKKLPGDHVIWHNHPDGGYQNGYTGRKIHVKVLSIEDGRGDIVDVAKKLVGEKQFVFESFDEGLKKRFEFPNPELAVCCGKTFSLFGYPPWQIPLTEFLSINSHHNLNFDCFVNLLHRYNQCEQRFGK